MAKKTKTKTLRNMDLSTERMEGYGEYKVDGFSVNYLFGLDDLCKKHVKKDFDILELGVNNGISTSLFLKYCNKLVAVDIIKTEKFERLLGQNENISFHQMNVADFYKFNESLFDLIYIDAGHEYEEVKNDISNCLRFLKPGGIICGHDYNSTYSGVIKAVNEFFEGVEIFNDSSWLKKM